MAKKANKQPESPFDDWDGEYLGNIWGWKISIYGLILIVAVLGLMIYRHKTLGIPFIQPDPVELDSTQTIIK